MDTTRISLIEQVRERQPDAWDEFVAIYGPFIRGYLRRVGIREADAEDLQQDVMQVLSIELPGFEHNRRTGAFRTWLRNIVANRIRAFHRSGDRRIRPIGGSEFREMADQLVDETSNLSRIWNSEHQRHVIDHLIRLISNDFSENTIIAFRETFLKERSADDVAKQLETTVNAVVIARCRVLKRLREAAGSLLD